MSTPYHYRITWLDGLPHLQRVLAGQLYSTHGEIVRPATEDDMRRMYSGGLAHDSETEPGRLAWAAHVRAGGD